MAFADFFDRAATAAGQILRGYEPDAFRTRLQNNVIAIAIDSTGAQSPEGVAALDLAVRLLARFYPRMAIVALDPSAEPAVRDAARLARAINRRIGLGNTLSRATACLVIGNTPVTLPRRAAESPIYIGSDGWIAKLSVAAPQGSGRSNNPFGGGAAACFGAANIFRQLFWKDLGSEPPNQEICLSMLSLQHSSIELDPSQLPEIDLGETHLAGLGAIGNAVVWALAHAPVRGLLYAIDHENTDLGNLQRYVLTCRRDKDRPKTEVVRDALSGSGLDVRLVPRRWAVAAAESEDWRFQRVAVALDTPEDRIALQASLPKRVINAWTQGGVAGVSRHSFNDDAACMACLYLPKGKVKNEDELVAEALGLLPHVREIRQMLDLGTALDRNFLERVAAARGVPLDAILPFEGQTLRILYTKGVCGGAVVEFGDRRRAEVPMAFVSALAGILLAGELVIDAAGLRAERVPTMTQVDLLRPLPPMLSSPRAKDPDGRCICQDPDFLHVFERKYS